MKFLFFAIVILALIGCSLSGKDHADVCRLPVDPGLCDAHFERYAFDTEKNKCVLFVYGGCQGNANNFETMEACKKACDKQ